MFVLDFEGQKVFCELDRTGDFFNYSDEDGNTIESAFTISKLDEYAELFLDEAKQERHAIRMGDIWKLF